MIPKHYVQIGPNEWADPSRLRNRNLDSVVPSTVQQDTVHALDKKPKIRRSRKAGVGCRVSIRVSIIRVSKTLLDDDSVVTSGKHIRDSIAKEIGIDDGDPRIKFEYGQIESSGRPGMIIKIELV